MTNANEKRRDELASDYASRNSMPEDYYNMHHDGLEFGYKAGYDQGHADALKLAEGLVASMKKDLKWIEHHFPDDALLEATKVNMRHALATYSKAVGK